MRVVRRYAGSYMRIDGQNQQRLNEMRKTYILQGVLMTALSTVELVCSRLGRRLGLVGVDVRVGDAGAFASARDEDHLPRRQENGRGGREKHPRVGCGEDEGEWHGQVD